MSVRKLKLIYEARLLSAAHYAAQLDNLADRGGNVGIDLGSG